MKRRHARSSEHSVLHGLLEQRGACVREAVRAAKATGGHLYVLHVIPGLCTAGEGKPPREATLRHPDAPRVLEHLQGAYISATDAEAEAVVRYGNETARILEFADSVDADVIVIGGRGVGAVAGFFGGGGVAEKILRNAKIPVLVVPPA